MVSCRQGFCSCPLSRAPTHPAWAKRWQSVFSGSTWSCCRKISAKTRKSTVRGSSGRTCCSACLQTVSATWGFAGCRWPRWLRTPLFALPTCPVPLICAFSGRKNDKLVKKQGGREQGSADGHGKQGGTGMGENGRAWGSVGPIGALHKAGKTW